MYPLRARGSEPEQFSKAMYLFLPVKLNQFFRNWPFISPKSRRNIATSQSQAAEATRASRYLIRDPEQLPQRMIPDGIVLDAKLELRRKYTSLGCSHSPMMQTDLLCERSSLPPLHSCTDHGNVVNGSTTHWKISPNRLKTFAAKDLTRS
jgi:hypothetical protein